MKQVRINLLQTLAPLTQEEMLKLNGGASSPGEQFNARECQIIYAQKCNKCDKCDHCECTIIDKP